MKKVDIFRLMGFNSIKYLKTWLYDCAPPRLHHCFLAISLCIPSIPRLATVQIYPLEFTLWEGHGGWSLFSTRNGGHRKVSLPRSPIGSCSVSEAQLTVRKWARKDCNLLLTISASGWEEQGDTLEKLKGPEVLSWIYKMSSLTLSLFSHL